MLILIFSFNDEDEAERTWQQEICTHVALAFAS